MLTQRYGDDALDASLLLAVLTRFLPADDPRIRATVLAIADELTEDGLVLRYRVEETDDGLSGEEGTFTICSFWLVSALVEIGELQPGQAPVRAAAVVRQPAAPLRRGDRAAHRPAPGQLPAGVHPPGADQRRCARHPRRGRLRRFRGVPTRQRADVGRGWCDCSRFSRISDQGGAIAMTARTASWLEALDPGFARTRRGARTACATVLSGLTMAAVTSAFGVADSMGIALFGAGACFFGALLVTDPHRSVRARTFGWASVVSAVAIVVTVELSRIAVWAAAAFLVVQMFLSYALRPWSSRAGDLAVIGALITFLTGAGRLSERPGRVVRARFDGRLRLGHRLGVRDPAGGSGAFREMVR